MIITNDDNIQPIYSFKNKDKRNRFPKAEIIIAFEFAVFGVSSSTLKTNQELGQFTNISGKSKVETSKAILIKNDDSILFKTNSAKAIANEVTKMSKVTREELNEKEKYFDEKINNLKNDVNSIKDDIKEINSNISKMSEKIVELSKDVKNMPDKIVVERYKFWAALIIAPIIAGVVLFILEKII